MDHAHAVLLEGRGVRHTLVSQAAKRQEQFVVLCAAQAHGRLVVAILERRCDRPSLLDRRRQAQRRHLR